MAEEHYCKLNANKLVYRKGSHKIDWGVTPVREIQSIPTLIVRTLANSLSDVNLILETTHVSRHLKDTISMAMSIIDITSNDIAASTALLMGELSCALSMLSTDGRHLLETCRHRS